MALEGLHHVTAITADAPRNVDFSARTLGLRLDEPAALLGEELKLPPRCEARRAQLEQALTPVTNPRAAA